MLMDQHVGTINRNLESSICKIKLSGDAGLTYYLTEHLSSSCWRAEERQIWITSVALEGLWTLTLSTYAVYPLCYSWGCE